MLVTLSRGEREFIFQQPDPPEHLTMTIAQLVYASEASKGTRVAIEDLLVSARAKNKGLYVTGYLCFRSDRFLQVLEGTPAAVSALYACIASDRRHSHVVLLGYEKVLKRRFSNWAMGYVADFGAAHTALFDYSGGHEFEPHEMDHRSAIAFLSELAGGTARRAALQEVE
jgi:hypothetical protein